MLNIAKVERLTRKINDAVRELAACKNEHKQVMLWHVIQYRNYKLKSYLDKHAGVIR